MFENYIKLTIVLFKKVQGLSWKTFEIDHRLLLRMRLIGSLRFCLKKKNNVLKINMPPNIFVQFISSVSLLPAKSVKI